jgi:hypothetical protein
MSALACCFWWFLAGLLLGWLLNWLLQKFMGKDDSSGSGGNSYNAPNQASNVYSGGAGAANTANVVKGASVSLAAAAGFKIKGNHDIEIIEGIGPKIGDLFRENDAGTFDKVMNLSVPQMNAILEKGGARFKLANPSTWAEQAKLCYENRWNELQTLQESLSAGIDKSNSSNT